VVVCTEHVDAAVKASGALVLVIGDVSGNVSGVSVAFNDYAISIISKGSGAKPNSTVFFEDVTHLTQALNRTLNGLGFIKRVLVEEDIKVNAEFVQ
jgi:hypothetical protein